MSITPPLSAASENLVSRVIDFVRFPLIVLVVSVHVHLNELVPTGTLQDFPIATFFYDLTGHGISRIAVPLFFFISGYLFFLNASHTSIVDGVSQRALHNPGRGAEPARQEQAQGREHGSFSRSLYFKKLKRRFWSLCVPLATWGTLFFLANFLAWKCGCGLELFRHQEAFANCSILEFARRFLSHGVFSRRLVPFWFLRSLIVACLLSPLWFFLLKKFKFLPLIVFGLWFCLVGVHSRLLWNSFGAVVAFFFCFGAYFSIHNIDFTKVFRRICIPFFIAYPILLVGNATLKLFGFIEFYENIQSLEAIFGLVAAVALVSLFLEKRPTLSFPKTLFDATFFVYAGHFFLIYLPIALFPSLFPCETNFGIITAFLCTTLFAVLACTLLSILVRKFAPWSVRFLTGGR